jgi:SAM-dependent methyltransferase
MLMRRAFARLRALAERRWYVLGRLPLVRGWRGHQLRRLRPLAGGRQRGTAVIRYYWERFLITHRLDIRGRALEVGSTETVRRLGGGAVLHAEAIDLAARPGIDIVGDLSRADALAAETYDCVVVPFTAHLIYDIDAAIYHAVRLLKPGGVLLVNFPCVDYYFPNGLDMQTGTTLFVHWWFTPIQVENLLRRIGLDAGDFTLTIDGNLFARVAYQTNLPIEELTAGERDTVDAGHPLLISARIVRPARWASGRPEYRDPWLPRTQPQQWNGETGHYPRS